MDEHGFEDRAQGWRERARPFGRRLHERGRAQADALLAAEQPLAQIVGGRSDPQDAGQHLELVLVEDLGKIGHAAVGGDDAGKFVAARRVEDRAREQ